MTNNVRVEKDDSVTVVTIDRPERRNAVDRDTAVELAEVFRTFEKDDEARVAVLAGAGGTFCAGADLKAISEGRGNRVAPDGDGPMGPSRMELAKPVIAAVSGHAVAGGMELACWCDLRIMEETAIFGVFCRRWGVPLIDGGTVRLPRIVGDGVALDLILTGRPVEAAEALAIGLANRVVPEGEARTAAIALGKDIAAFPQETMLADRAGVYRGRDLPLSEALRRETEEGLKVFEIGQAGAQRFASGRGRGGRFDDVSG